MNTRRIISSITRVNTLPPANETNCFINSSTVLVGAANTHILLVKNAKSTASTHEITFAISSLIPSVTLKNAYEPILTTVVSTPKKRYRSTSLYFLYNGSNTLRPGRCIILSNISGLISCILLSVLLLIITSLFLLI